MIAPVMITYMLICFTCFDFAPNFYAELTGFADCQFYQDYWNSTNFDEYQRKWNKLVHEYLFRHWYLEFLARYRTASFTAMVMTVFFSVLFHELCLTVIFRQVSWYLSAQQLCQILWILLLRPMQKTILGNLVHWGGILVGVSMSTYLYFYDYSNFYYLHQ